MSFIIEIKYDVFYYLRCFIVVLIGVSVAWVPIIENFQGGQLFFYIQEVSNYISPPIAAIFLVSMLWTKCTEKVYKTVC